MAQKEANTERTGDAPFAMLAPTAFAELGKQRLEDFANTQTELLDKLLETNRQWFDRMQLEANVASELGSKLTASRSIPDAMTAWQEWATRRFEMMAEDRKHLLTDCQIFTETGARLLSKGWLQNGSGKSA
ncbi:MAG: hypothetical protein ACLP19_28275 [Xanthobacteraceae bacterium]